MAPRTARVSSRDLSRELTTEGGFTVHEKTGERPKQGYAVSDFGAEEAFAQPGAGPTDVENYRRTYAEQLAGPRKFFGGWRDTSDTTDYLDTSEVVATRREAFSIGHDNAQRAVMDLSNFKEHSVPFKPGLPGSRRTGMAPSEYRAAEGENRELGRRMVENQRFGREATSMDEVQQRGAAIADDLIAREGLHAEVRGRHPRAQVKRGRV
jgi:hypothetical protein